MRRTFAQPGLRRSYILRSERMAGGDRMDLYVSAAGAEKGREPRRVLGGNERVHGPVAEKDAVGCERAWAGGLIEYDHGTKERPAAECFRPQQQQGRGNVRAVRKSHRKQPEGVD